MTNYRSAAVATFLSSALLAGAAVAGTIQGDVKGVDGRVAQGAEVRIERQDKKGPAMIVKTDRRGGFLAKGLPDGNYSVMAIVAGGVRSPAQVVKSTAAKPLMVSFDLRNSNTPMLANGKPAKKKTKHIWVPNETGSHLGGHWVEVDEDATDAGPSANHISKTSGAEVKRLQTTQGMSNSMGGGSGH